MVALTLAHCANVDGNASITEGYGCFKTAELLTECHTLISLEKPLIWYLNNLFCCVNVCLGFIFFFFFTLTGNKTLPCEQVVCVCARAAFCRYKTGTLRWEVRFARQVPNAVLTKHSDKFGFGVLFKLGVSTRAFTAQ